MYYDHAGLKHGLDAGTLQRGQDYARKGMVRAARRDGDRLVGEVSGSGNEPYRQTIRFRAERGGIGFQGSCSCPMSYNCKHVVALLLAGQQQPVFVYKLIARGTLEEKIQELQRRKGELADAVLSNEGEKELAPGLQADDLRAIFSLDASPAPR
jgi:uncharacterized Zn finger protein